MTNRTAVQNSRLHGLLGELHIDTETKADLVHQFTNGRSASSRDLSYFECEELIKHLRKMKAEKAHPPGQKMRRKIFAHFIKMGYTLESGKVDQQAVYSWVEKYGYLHKPLMKYNADELPRLVSQVEAMYLGHMKRLSNGTG